MKIFLNVLVLIQFFQFTSLFAQIENDDLKIRLTTEFFTSYQQFGNSTLDDRYNLIAESYRSQNINFPENIEQKAAFLFGFKLMFIESFLGYSGISIGFGRKQMNVTYEDVYGFYNYKYRVSTLFFDEIQEYNFYRKNNLYLFLGCALGSTINFAEIDEELHVNDFKYNSGKKSINAYSYSYSVCGSGGVRIESSSFIYSISCGYRFSPVYSWYGANEISNSYYDIKGLFIMAGIGYNLYSE